MSYMGKSYDAFGGYGGRRNVAGSMPVRYLNDYQDPAYDTFETQETILEYHPQEVISESACPTSPIDQVKRDFGAPVRRALPNSPSLDRVADKVPLKRGESESYLPSPALHTVPPTLRSSSADFLRNDPPGRKKSGIGFRQAMIKRGDSLASFFRLHKKGNGPDQQHSNDSLTESPTQMRSPSIHEPSLPAGSVGRQTGLGRIGRASIAPEMSATGTMRRGKLPPHLFRMSISKAGHGEHDAETGLNLNKKLSLGHLGPDDMDDDADIWSGSTDELSLYSMGSYSSVYVPRTFQLFAEYHGHSFPVRVLSHGSVADAIQSIMIDLCHYLETSGSNISESISISDQNKAQFRLCKLERYSPGVRTWMDPAHVLGTYDFMSGDEVRLKHVEDIERTCVIVPPSSVRHTLEYGFDAVVKDVVAKLREEHVGNKEEKYGLYYPRYGIWLEDGKTLFSYDLQPEHHLELRALANQFLLRIYLPQFDQKIALKALPNLRTSDVIAMIHYQLSNRKLTLSGRGRYNLFLPSQNLWLKESATLEDYKTIATEDVQYKLQYELVLVTLQVPTLEKTPPLRLLIDSTTTVETLIQSVGLRNPGHLDGGYCIYSPAGDRLNEKELVWTAAKDLTDADSLQYRAVPHRVNLSNTFDRNVRIDVDIDFALALERSVKFMCRRFGVDRSLLKAVWTETGSVLDLGLSLDAQSVFAGTKLVLDISPPVTVRSRNPTDATDDSVPIWEESDSPDNLQLTKDNQGVLVVASGTLNKLVERLTDEMGEGTSQYLDYVKTFLLTYQSFTTGSVLLRKLMERYHAPRDRKPTWASYDHFRLTIQLRVCNVLLQWVKRHPSDFVSQKDKEVHPFWHTAMEFVETVLAWDHANMARQIRRNLVKIKDRSHPGLVKHHIIKSSPKFGEHERTGGVWRYGSEEIARQLTILEHGYFADILPSELLNQSWSKGDASEKAPNIIKLTRRFNAVACWCAKSILELKTPRARGKRISILIDIATHLLSLNNFSTLMSIIAGLNNASVSRLKQSFREVSSRHMKKLQELERLMTAESSYKAYRECVKGVLRPAIPYIGVYLIDLTYMEDGNPSTLAHRINFTKRQMISSVINEIVMYQQQGYDIERVEGLYEVLGRMPVATDELEKWLWGESKKRE